VQKWPSGLLKVGRFVSPLLPVFTPPWVIIYRPFLSSISPDLGQTASAGTPCPHLACLDTEERKNCFCLGPTIFSFPKGPPDTYAPAEGGRAFERVDAHMVGSLLAKAANTSALGDDRISADILKIFWQWDRQRITQLVRACIRTGYHPKIWKTAKGVVIPKPGKPDYAKVRAYRVISLLDVIGKLVERTAAHLIADHLERKRALHEGQYGCRKRRSCVDAVAILMNRSQQAWAAKKVAGALFMDVKAAFNNVNKTHLGKRMQALGIEPDLIR